jgi:HSP20 family protein
MVFYRLPESSLFPGFRNLREQVDQLFRDFEGPRFADESAGFPAINVTASPEEVVVVAEVPGVAPADLDLSLTGDTLTLRGKRNTLPEGVEESWYHRRERRTGDFVRMVTLPDRVDAGRIQAECRDGLLVVRLPKAPESRPRQIPVQAS